VVSEDTDVALYGAPLLRRISTRSTSSFESPDEEISKGDDWRKMNVLDPVALREALGLTKEEFIDFALLCGTDFTERIPRYAISF
jgi:5'-3' exonuclease